MLKTLLLLIVFIFLSYLTYENQEKILDTLNPQKKAKEEKRVSKKAKVLVQDIQTMTNDIIYKSIGSAIAKESVDIYPLATEQLTDIYFSAGEFVKKGEILVQLKDDEENLAIELAQLQLEKAKLLYERNKKALQKNAVSESVFDDAYNTYKKALLDVKKAQIALDKKRILAPFSGIMGIPKVNVGDKVTPDTLIAGLDNIRLLYVEFEIPQSLQEPLNIAIKNKKSISLQSPSFANKKFEGYFLAKEIRINPSTRSIKARLALENKELQIAPGSSFEILWKIEGKEYPLIPETSLQWENEGSFVWIIDKQKASKNYVKIIARKDGKILIEGDIQKGQKVVTEGVQRLKEGTDVIIVGET